MRGSRNFRQGGGGGGSLTARKQPGQRCFFFFFFFFWISFSPQLILQFTEGVQWFYDRENYTFQRIEGVQLFYGGGGGGSRVQVLISIETHITCDFPGAGGGGPDPLSPLWIRTWSHRRITLPHYMCKLPGRVKSVNSNTVCK